ncbi:unnamed protein product, partial [Amoebophrya sp. A120]
YTTEDGDTLLRNLVLVRCNTCPKRHLVCATLETVVRHFPQFKCKHLDGGVSCEEVTENLTIVRQIREGPLTRLMETYRVEGCKLPKAPFLYAQASLLMQELQLQRRQRHQQG